MSSTRPGAKRATNSAPDPSDQMEALFSVISDPMRLRTLLVLAAEGEKRVGELIELFGAPQPTVSHHLATLRRHELVRSRRSGRNVIYSLGETVSSSDDGALVVRTNGFSTGITLGEA